MLALPLSYSLCPRFSAQDKRDSSLDKPASRNVTHPARPKRRFHTASAESCHARYLNFMVRCEVEQTPSYSLTISSAAPMLAAQVRHTGSSNGIAHRDRPSPSPTLIGGQEIRAVNAA